MRRRVLWLLSFAGCASAPLAPGAVRTKYRRGDFIEYRYSGAALEKPVDLRERIVEQRGDHLDIDVVAKRPGEERHWLQQVTDTPENQRNNHIDALYEFDASGARKRLENANNADLLRLYAWTLIFPDGKAHHLTHDVTTMKIGGASYTCNRTRGENTFHGRPIDFEEVTCPDFLWEHAFSRFVDAANGTELLRVEVGAVGRD